MTAALPGHDLTVQDPSLLSATVRNGLDPFTHCQKLLIQQGSPQYRGPERRGQLAEGNGDLGGSANYGCSCGLRQAVY